MYIISVIPLTKVPFPAPQILDYFSSNKAASGAVVEITLGHRRVFGIAIACVPVAQQKQLIKKAGFKIKPVERIINPSVVIPEHHIKLVLWLSAYFYAPLGLVVKSLLPQVFSRPTKKFLKNIECTLFTECLCKKTAVPQKHLLMSPLRKRTRTYEKLIKKTLSNKKSVLFLMPEVYKIEYWQSKLPILKKAEVIQGKLSGQKEYAIWEKVRSGQGQCYIGTRSALTLPICNLGLIILDEEENTSYKSYDQQPYLNAREAAMKLSELTGAKMILGSAFPTLETLGKTVVKNIRYTNTSLPSLKVDVVDMREEIKGGNYSIFSRKLQGQLSKLKGESEQAILFINRKGLATGLLCRDCGHVVKCPLCDVALVFYRTPILVCHHCGKKETPPSTCPKCGGLRVKFIGSGTQRVEQELQKLKVETQKVCRLDLECAPTWQEQKKIFDAFREKKCQFLIGTQLMLKEGLLPRVDFAAIITIDPLLSIPDFRMNERVLRTIHQLARHTAKPILLQTYFSENYFIKNLTSGKELNVLLKEELAARKELAYPPFSQLIKLAYMHASSAKAEQEAKVLKNKLQTIVANLRLSAEDLKILGPAPSFIPRVKYRYIWQIMLKSRLEDLRLRNKVLAVAPSDWKIDVDPLEVI